MIGNNVGEGNANRARRTARHISIFAAVVGVIVLIFMVTSFDRVWSLFTEKKDLMTIYKDTLPYFIAFHMLDFAQLTICGPIRALGL